MALVSTDPVVVTTIDPILYDSGWKHVKGTGSATVIETMTDYAYDSIVYVYGKRHYTTLCSDWKVYVNMYPTSNFAASNHEHWQSTYDRGLAPLSSSNAFITGHTYINAPHSTSYTINPTRSEKGGTLGYDLMKGNTLKFQAESSASTSDGIEYRIVVVRSDGLEMTNKR